MRARVRRLRAKATKLWLHGRWLQLLRQRAAAAEARGRGHSRTAAADAHADRARLTRGAAALRTHTARRADAAAAGARHEAAAEQLRSWLRRRFLGRGLLRWLARGERRAAAAAAAGAADRRRRVRAVGRWVERSRRARRGRAAARALSEAAPRLAAARQGRRLRGAWAQLHQAWWVELRLRVALPGCAYARATASKRRALAVLRRLCAMRRVAQAMGGRSRAARAVASWRAAALEEGWAREAMAVAGEAHLGMQRARRAAAVARCWVRLRRRAEARALEAQRTAKAVRVHGKLMVRWRRLQLAAGLLHWAAEARARRAFGDKCRRARRLQPLLFPQWVSWQVQHALARWVAEARRRLQRRKATRRELAYLQS